MKVQILSAALRDLAQGYHFYERQEPGVGAYFLDSISAEIDDLAFEAGIHPVSYGYHRKVSKRFPHAVYYQVKEDTAYVLAVADCRRSPAWIKRRLDSGNS